MTVTDTQPDDPHRFMTVEEVAAALRVSRATVYRLISAGSLPGLRVGKSLRVSRRLVEELMHCSDPTDDTP